MQKKTVLILLVILIPGMFYSGFKCSDELRDWDKIGGPDISYVGFINNSLTDSVYLISKRWGLTGDHQIYSLSPRKPEKNEWHPNYLQDCIWQGDPIIFYQQVNDRIRIYTTQLPRTIPEFYSKHNIEIRLIDYSERQFYKDRMDSSIRRLH